MAESIVAFVSYAHDDDIYDAGGISKLARKLEHAVRTFTGIRDLRIFFDRQSIEWGDAWRERVATGLSESTLLISVVTPNYLTSPECRREVEDFLNASGRERWLLPLYYIEVRDFDILEDHICALMRTYQYEDWRPLRDVTPSSVKVRRAIERLARRIRDLLGEVAMEKGENVAVAPAQPRNYRAQPTVEEAMGTESDASDAYDYLLSAQAAREEEEYGLARALILDALDRYQDPELLLELATIDWYAGWLEESIEEFEQAISAGVDQIIVRQALGQVRVELGDYERGIDDLTTVIEGDDDYLSRAYAKSTRALALGGLGRFDEALSEFAAAERVTPENAWLHFNRARVLDWMGEKDAAMKSYLRSLVATKPSLNRPKRVAAQQQLNQLGWFL